MSKYTIAALVSSFISILDFATKKMIVTRLNLYESINVLPFLNIVYVENRGAAFSMFSNLGNHYFIAISILAISAILIYLYKLPKGLEFYAMSMILGGAAGNLTDRIREGKVIDFIDVFIDKWHWPAFNVADSALTVGITLFIIANFRHAGKPKEQ